MWREWGEMVVVKVWKVETEVKSNILYEYRISTASEHLYDLHQLLFVTCAMNQQQAILTQSHNTPTTPSCPRQSQATAHLARARGSRIPSIYCALHS